MVKITTAKSQAYGLAASEKSLGVVECKFSRVVTFIIAKTLREEPQRETYMYSGAVFLTLRTQATSREEQE